MLEIEFEFKVADCNCGEFNFDIKVELRVIKVGHPKSKKLNLKKFEAEHAWMCTKFEIKEIWLNQANQVNTRNLVKSR